MTTPTYNKDKIIKCLEKLPQESLLELAQFIEYLQDKNQRPSQENRELLTLEQSEQLTEELLAEIGDNLPSLSDYAVSRAGIYEEHP